MRSLLGGDEQLMELRWQNGQVVTHTQNHRSYENVNSASGSTGGGGGGVDIPLLQSASTSHAREELLMDGESGWSQPAQQVFGQEDDLSSWLQFAIDDLDSDFYSHLLYSAPTAPQNEITTCSGLTNEEILRCTMPPPPPYTNFLLPQSLIPPFTSTIAAAGPSSICSTDVDGIAAAAPNFQSVLNLSRVPTGTELVPSSSGWHVGGTKGASTSNARKDVATGCKRTVTASPGASTASGSIEGRTPSVRKLTNAEGKRREREVEKNACQCDDDDDHAVEVKKITRKPNCVKKTRTAEVHNLSERRRRDKINSKFKILQGLIPNCTKSDKASMLDEAIKYMKSLKLHVEIMSMGGGGGMNPMMYTGSQHQYMAAMGMMGMGMRPMITYPIPGFPPEASGAAPSFHMPPFPVQPVLLPPNTARTPPVPVHDYSTFNPLYVQQGPNSDPSLVDPRRQLTGFQEPQVPTWVSRS